MLKWLKKNKFNLLICFFYLIMSLFFLLPVLLTFSLAIKTPSEIFSYPPRLIPKHPTLMNFVTVWHTTPMVTYLYNSTKLVFITVLGTLAVAVPGAYSLSRFTFKNKTVLLFGILIFQMISVVILVIPIYVYFDKLGFLNNHFTLAMVYIAIEVPFIIWILKGFFDAIPTVLEEAARIDGCSRFQALIRIVLPLVIPGVASATIFIAIDAWAGFILPFILLDNDMLYPATVGMALFQGTYRDISTHLIAATSIMVLAPAVIIVLVLQKFIFKMLVTVGIKG